MEKVDFVKEQNVNIVSFDNMKIKLKMINFFLYEKKKKREDISINSIILLEKELREVRFFFFFEVLKNNSVRM